MEVIKVKVSQITRLKNQVEVAEQELDVLIHEKFLEVNKITEDSQFVVNGKTIGKTCVKGGSVKGNFLKKDGELSTSVVNITVDRNYKIVR